MSLTNSILGAQILELPSVGVSLVEFSPVMRKALVCSVGTVSELHWSAPAAESLADCRQSYNAGSFV